MKIRTGFVSNSSSSSFVLAIRDDCALGDIESEIAKDKQSLKSFIDFDFQYTPEYEDFKDAPKEEVENFVVHEIAKDIFATCKGRSSNGIKLDNWYVASGEYGNEDCGLAGCYIYSHLSIDTEKIKIRGFS